MKKNHRAGGHFSSLWLSSKVFVGMDTMDTEKSTLGPIRTSQSFKVFRRGCATAKWMTAAAAAFYGPLTNGSVLHCSALY